MQRTKRGKIFREEFKESIDPKTILSIWKSAGIKLARGGHRNGLSEFEFLELYYLNFGDADAMTEKINGWLETIINRYQKLKLGYSKKKKLQGRKSY